MSVALAAIICPIVFGISFAIQTSYFIYKTINAQKPKSDSCLETRITMTEGEVTCCMGWAWNSCVDKTTNSISFKTFFIWYLVGITLDIVVTVLFYLVIYQYQRIYV